MTHLTADPPRAEARAPGVTVTAHAFYFTGEDHLRLSSFNSATGVTIGVRGRVLRVDGSIEVFSASHVPNTDRTLATQSFARGEGWLLDCELFVTAGTPRRGQCFVVLEVVRGFTGAVFALSTLIQGYVTDTQRRGWPPAMLEMSTEGPGVLRSITGTDPAAGAEIVETVPTNARWRPLAITFDLVTGIVVTNREVSLIYDDGATTFARVPTGTLQAASLTRTYSSFHHAPRNTIANDTTLNLPMPRIDLQGGHRIRTVTDNLQAADNLSAPQLLVEEWIED